MDREAGHAAVRRVAKSQTGLSGWTELTDGVIKLIVGYDLGNLEYGNPLQYSCRKIPWTDKSGRRSQGVGNNWACTHDPKESVLLFWAYKLC